MSYVEVRDVCKKIGPEQVLDSVSFSVDSGEVACLEGENGSGKTMAMRVVCGLVRPDSGTVEVSGKRLWGEVSFPPSVGLLIETPALLDGLQRAGQPEPLGLHTRRCLQGRPAPHDRARGAGPRKQEAGAQVLAGHAAEAGHRHGNHGGAGASRPG
jgi:hypothetical protein